MWRGHVALGGALAILTGSALGGGCIVPPIPDPPPVEGVLFDGACMCSLCWNQEFCVPEDGSAPFAAGGVPCPVGTIESVPASRVSAAVNMRDPAQFFCVPVEGKDLNPSSPTCANPAEFAFVDPCEDVDEECRLDMSCPAPVGSVCNDPCAYGSVKTACGSASSTSDPNILRLGQIDAAQKLSGPAYCGRYGSNIPSDPSGPSRFCWLNCMEPVSSATRLDQACDPDFVVCAYRGMQTMSVGFAPPVGPFASGSEATVTIRDLASNEEMVEVVDVRGTASFVFSRDCLPPIAAGVQACDSFVLSALRLESIEDAEFGDTIARDIVTFLPSARQATAFGGSFILATLGQPVLPGTPTPNFVSAFITDETPFFASGLTVPTGGIVGDRVGFPSQTDRTVTLYVDWTTGEVFGNVQLENVQNGIETELELELEGALENRPPVAVVEPAFVTAECTSFTGAVVELSGQGSTDPDGDIASYRWSVFSPFPQVVGSGPQVAVKAPLGSSLLVLTVTDGTSLQDSASTLVTVEDTIPPEIVLDDSDVPIVRCSSSSVDLPLPKVFDACTEFVELTGTVIAVDGQAIDPIPLVDGSAAVPEGVLTVQWIATDESGNVTVEDQDFVVESDPIFTVFPPNLTTSKCTGVALGHAAATDACGGAVTVINDAPAKFPIGTSTVTWTAIDDEGRARTATQHVSVHLGDDPLCCPAGTNVILGTSNNDTLNGTSGADCILGRGAQDVINGNGGADLISGGEGNDTINGGSGNDSIFGGSGQDAINGSSGNDTLNGGDGDDSVLGGIGDDTLEGGQGQDTLRGEDGHDRLFGGTGDDNLQGGNGNDTLTGGVNNDTCTGGSGVNLHEGCDFGAPNSCADGLLSGTETAPDCGGGCGFCSSGEECASGGDCASNVCSGNVCQDIPGGLSIIPVVDADWGGGYCVHLDATNVRDFPTVDWAASIDTNQTAIYTSWNASFSGATGVVTIVPNHSFKSIAPGATLGSVGFCANRSAPGSGTLPFVVAASATH